ncbi:hypothetical protein PR048_004876 [Dryococelus australis]|uniref:Uncharacterized protein n=1 Tax=Dryococelus australis TaxID=614101 RepID=A0ABQ9I7J0_9NEOP|nr:hypothetical protein PR048_004876 [Dryococelus australis]
MPRPRSCAADIDTVLQTIRRFKEQIVNEGGSIVQKKSDVWTNISESLNYDVSSNYAYTIVKMNRYNVHDIFNLPSKVTEPLLDQEGEYFSSESGQDEDVLSENSTTEDMNNQQFVVTLFPEECARVAAPLLPNDNRHVLINFKYRGPFVDCSTGIKRILKGTRRRSALEELVEKNVSVCTVRREEARRSIHLGGNEPSHIPILNALRLAKSRELKSRRVDDDPILTVGRLKYSAEYYSIASDATGGITAKLKRPFGNVSGVVYLYSVAVHDHEAGVHYTVANMFSESHNNLRIHHFLESWLRSDAPVLTEEITKCEKAKTTLKNLFATGLNISLQSAIDTILDEDNCPKENSFPEGVENEGETPTDFMKWAHQIISEVKGNLEEEEGDHDNLHFLPEIVVCIAKLMKFLPLCAPVETIFNDIKHRTFQNVHLPTTLDRFLETHLRSLDGELKLVAATSPRKKVLMQRETDASQVIKNILSLDISQNTTREDGSEVIGNNKLNNSKYKTGIISAHNPKCFACSRCDFPSGAHACSVCGTPVHAAFSKCSIPYDRSEERYGEKRLCVKCADKVRTAGNNSSAKDIQEDSAKENWKGLASLPPKKRQRLSYLEPSSEFQETCMSTLLSAVTFILTNTCSFDSLVQILATSYTDSVHYKDFVQNNNNITIFKVVESLARNITTSGTYTKKIQSLNNLEACIISSSLKKKMQCSKNCDGLKIIVSTSSNQHLLIEVVNSSIVSNPSDIAYHFEVPLKDVSRKITLKKSGDTYFLRA